jgi:hypothetical protein
MSISRSKFGLVVRTSVRFFGAEAPTTDEILDPLSIVNDSEFNG